MVTPNIQTAQRGAGDFDLSFGESGKVLLETSVLDLRGVISVVVTAERKTVALLTGMRADAEVFGLVRLHTDGSLDADFGNNGWVLGNFTKEGASRGRELLQTTDGKLIVTGLHFQSFDPLEASIAVAQYVPNGHIDADFGDSGVSFLTVTPPEVNRLTFELGADLDAEGRILIGYSEYSNGTREKLEGVLVRLRPDGRLDKDFSGRGYIKFTLAQSQTRIVGVLTTEEGGSLVFGALNDSGPEQQALVARYHANGELDTGFGEDGIVRFSASTGGSRLFGTVLRPDGGIVALGTTTVNGLSQGMLAAFTAQGLPDNAFNGGLPVITSLVDHVWTAGVTDRDGNIIIIGSVLNGPGAPPRTYVARHLTDGTLDPAFGLKEFRQFLVVPGARPMALGSDVRMTFAAYFYPGGGSNSQGAVLRLLT